MLHIFSPIFYGMFVKLISFIQPIPNSFIMKLLRKIHNIFLSLLSLAMLIGITWGCYIDGKFNSINDFFCSPITNEIAQTSVSICLYSKYLEWGDTLFLHLSGKTITMLQYTHHMTTAFLVYINTFI